MQIWTWFVDKLLVALGFRLPYERLTDRLWRHSARRANTWAHPGYVFDRKRLP